MGALRKLKRKNLKKKLENMGVQKPTKHISTYWKDYNAGREI